MWTPTHAQVTVHQARNLVPKGKGGTNDGYVTIQLGKEKYQTSVKERSENPEWHEECDMRIGSAKEVHLNVFHRSFLGLDDFLGHVALPLDQFQIYERPRSRWYALKGRPGKKGDTKYRGEIECKITFVVQSKKEDTEVLRRAGSIKNLANTMSEKFKLPARSSSFKDKDDNSKKKAFVEPFLRSPSDRVSLPPEIPIGFSDPMKMEQAPFASTEQELQSQLHAASDEYGDYNEMSVDMPVPKRALPEPTIERPKKSLTSKLDQQDTAPEAFSTIRMPSIQRRKTLPNIILAAVLPNVTSDSTKKRNEADLNKRWRSADVNKRTSAEEGDAVIRHKQPLYKTSLLPSTNTTETSVVPPADAEAPLLKRTTCDAEVKLLQKDKGGGSTDDLKSLRDTREMTKSLSKLDEVVEMSDTLLMNRSRNSMGSSIPESIPEETSPEIPSTINQSRLCVPGSKRMQEGRRHSMQIGAEDISVPAHLLQEVKRKAISISPELSEEYRGITREELIKLVHTQKTALYSKDMYIRDLERYIDDLLVRVMESTPRILQNPFSTMRKRTDVTLLMTPSSDNVVNISQSPRKMPVPYKMRT